MSGTDLLQSNGAFALPDWQSCAYHSEVHGTEIEAVLLVVKAGRGIGRTLSYQVADDFASGALVRLLGEFEPFAWPVHLVVQPRNICRERFARS